MVGTRLSPLLLPSSTRNALHAASGLKILCFPHAGGGPSCFSCWRADLPEGCTIVPVCLPGREQRFSVEIPENLDQLLSDLAEQLEEPLTTPFAILGHSMGALIGFEFARYLRRTRQSAPVHLFVSAFRAPQLPSRSPTASNLSDAALIATVMRLQGTPREVLQQGELLRLLLPILRADLRICDRYRYQVEPPLACPISCFAGSTDLQVWPEELYAWRLQTRGKFRLHFIDGGHFFLYQARAIILVKMLADLDFRHRFITGRTST
jgi:medium-chain acyl-[acyl-carrier-protein] hydrolase